MGRSDKLLMFVGCDDTLEIPTKEPKQPRNKGKVVRCSDEAYKLLSSFASEYRVPISRVIDELADCLATNPTTFKAVISRFGY